MLNCTHAHAHAGSAVRLSKLVTVVATRTYNNVFNWHTSRQIKVGETDNNSDKTTVNVDGLMYLKAVCF